MPLVKEGRNFSLTKESKEPRIPEKFRDLSFGKIIAKILGKGFFVSIVFVGQADMRKVNKRYRGIHKPTDVLAFGLGAEPEILLSLNSAGFKARTFGAELGQYLSYLIIHALLHLKGLSHGSKMDRQEKKYCRLFQIKYPFN
jgi:rRNA maturation RNase YbeY